MYLCLVQVKPVQKVPQALPPPKNAPASLQNIYKLCTDTSKVSIEAKVCPAQCVHCMDEVSNHAYMRFIG